MDRQTDYFTPAHVHGVITVSGRWETLPILPSRRMKWATSTITHVFLSATPFDHTQLCHVLLQLRMLELCIGKGRCVHKLRYAFLCMHSGHGSNCY